MAAGQDDDRSKGRLALIAGLGFVALIPPVIAAFDRGGRVFGVPVIWAYLFIVWAVVVGLVAGVAGRSR